MESQRICVYIRVEYFEFLIIFSPDDPLINKADTRPAKTFQDHIVVFPANFSSTIKEQQLQVTGDIVN